MGVESLGLSDITIEMFRYPTNAVQIFCAGQFDNYLYLQVWIASIVRSLIRKIYARKLNALESKPQLVDLNVHWKLSTIPSVH